MTYQFDPAPKGLRFEPFTHAMSHKTMYYMRDVAPYPWLDMKSVCKVLLIRWYVFRGICMARQNRWEAESGLGQDRQESLLIPLNKMPQVLAELTDLMQKGRQSVAVARLNRFRTGWQDCHLAICNPEMVQSPRIKMLQRIDDQKQGRGRPTIRGGEAYSLVAELRAQGKSIRQITAVTGIGRSTVFDMLNFSLPASPEMAEGFWKAFSAEKRG